MVNYNLAAYYDGSNTRPKDSFRISPSSIEKFFSDKTTWYRENVMGEARKFTGSTATVLGEIVHFAAEIVAECKIQGEAYNSELLHEEVEKHIAKFDGDEDYDTNMIRINWEGMSQLLIKEYVIGTNIVSTEQWLQHEVRPNLFIGGTADAIVSSAPTDTWDDIINGTHVGVLTLRDWKTASTKPSTFNYAYSLQAYSYAYMLAKKGIKVDYVELCFVVRPTKTLPARVFNFKKEFTSETYNFIESLIFLISESVECFKNYEDLQYLLASDYRLKKNDIPQPKA